MKEKIGNSVQQQPSFRRDQIGVSHEANDTPKATGRHPSTAKLQFDLRRVTGSRKALNNRSHHPGLTAGRLVTEPLAITNGPRDTSGVDAARIEAAKEGWHSALRVTGRSSILQAGR